MKIIIDLFESNYWLEGWKENYENREEFENFWQEEFIDCDYLFLNGEKEEVNAVWVIERNNEVIYYDPQEKYEEIGYIEEILENFYNNKKPSQYGFIELDLGFRSFLDSVDITKLKDYIEANPKLFYRGGTGYSYSAWQYNR